MLLFDLQLLPLAHLLTAQFCYQAVGRFIHESELKQLLCSLVVSLSF